MDESKLFLGIDYGGNAVKLGIVDGAGNLAGKASRPTSNLQGKSDCRKFANDVADFVHGMGFYSSELGGVGLAIPGIIAHETYFAPNVSVDWALLLEILAKTFGKTTVAAINDANAAALGEMWMGAGGNAQSAILVTLGSGLGSGLIVDGNVVTGGHGAAGEVGHMTVVPGGRPCGCGRRGCAERYVSARGIVQTFLEAAFDGDLDQEAFTSFEPATDTDALSVFKAFEAGDPRAKRALSVMCDKLGFALAQVSCVIDPDVILLGGGMAAGSQHFIDELRECYRKYCLDSCKGTEIRTASLESDAGIIGAARYAMTQSPHDDAMRDWLDPDFGL